MKKLSNSSNEYTYEPYNMNSQSQQQKMILRNPTNSLPTNFRANTNQIFCIFGGVLLIVLSIVTYRQDTTINDLLKSIQSVQQQIVLIQEKQANNQTNFEKAIEDIKLNSAGYRDNIQKDVQKLQEQIKADSSSLNDQTNKFNLLTRDIEDIKNEIQEVTSLSKTVSDLQSDSSKLQSEMTSFSPKIDGMGVKIEEIKYNLNNVSTQQQTVLQFVYSMMPNNTSTNFESEISSIKQSIANIQSSISKAEITNSIESYGPFLSSFWIQSINLKDNTFTYIQTSTQCSITTKGKAVITLIATGLGYCGSCHAQLTFLKDRKINLQSSGYKNCLYGASFVYTDWLPINLTQEFVVEEGTHEFVLGANLADGGSFSAHFQSLSFIAKVTYVS